jgi:light-regulated signal transduction histidine kinase (bacteriophytochrome)
MLTNLLGNACKFTSKKSEAVIEFGKGIADEKNVYFIRDNGAGFNKESAKKLFGAFQRMHKQSEFPGTGVGLATVQRIINRHQGNIWVDAAIDKGATFYFTLGTNLVLQEQHSI